jgi:hypothetical protein
VLQVSRRFGCWLWSDCGDAMVYHLDGRKFLARTERQKFSAFNAGAIRYRLAEAAEAAGAGSSAGGAGGGGRMEGVGDGD